MTTQLIFIYNAKSDLINSAFDFAHKIIHPASYPCSLCKLTHGAVSEKKEWVEFRENSELDMKFYHKEEFEKLYDYQTEYPVLFQILDSQLIPFILTDELNSSSDTSHLIQKIQNKLMLN